MNLSRTLSVGIWTYQDITYISIICQEHTVTYVELWIFQGHFILNNETSRDITYRTMNLPGKLHQDEDSGKDILTIKVGLKDFTVSDAHFLLPEPTHLTI